MKLINGTSDTTMKLIQKRSEKWKTLNLNESKLMNKEISRSVRNDYRIHVERSIEDIEEAEIVGNTTVIFKLAKQLKPKGKGNLYCQPSKDTEGKPITSTEKQLEEWEKFIEKKFEAPPNETEINCDNLLGEGDPPNINIEEVTWSVNHLKWGKATGPDTIPIEQFKTNNTAIEELPDILQQLWNDDIPDEFVECLWRIRRSVTTIALTIVRWVC